VRRAAPVYTVLQSSGPPLPATRVPCDVGQEFRRTRNSVTAGLQHAELLQGSTTDFSSAGGDFNSSSVRAATTTPQEELSGVLL